MILFFAIVTVIGPAIILAGLIVLAARDGRASRKTLTPEIFLHQGRKER
jgi:hypothetical protein